MEFTLDELIEFVLLCAAQARDCKHESYPAFVAVRKALELLKDIDNATEAEEKCGRVPTLPGVWASEGNSNDDGADIRRQVADRVLGERLPEVSGNWEDL